MWEWPMAGHASGGYSGSTFVVMYRRQIWKAALVQAATIYPHLHRSATPSLHSCGPRKLLPLFQFPIDHFMSLFPSFAQHTPR